MVQFKQLAGIEFIAKLEENIRVTQEFPLIAEH
jgi:hypothetical protein